MQYHTWVLMKFAKKKKKAVISFYFFYKIFYNIKEDSHKYKQRG